MESFDAVAAWTHLTNWGNSVLLMPTALVIAIGLWIGGRRRLALRWAVGFAAAVLLTLATKIAFLGWGLGVRSLDFTGISGHSVLAASVLTMLAWWVAQDSPNPAMRTVIVAIGVVVAALIGWSRLVLHTHSPSEVVSGLALGFATAWLATAPVPRRDHDRWVRWAILVALLLGFVLPLGHAVDEPHQLVTRIALALSGRTQVFTRALF